MKFLGVAEVDPHEAMDCGDVPQWAIKRTYALLGEIAPMAANIVWLPNTYSARTRLAWAEYIAEHESPPEEDTPWG